MRRLFPQSLRGQLIAIMALPMVALLGLLAALTVLGVTRMTQALVEERDAELVQLAVQQVADYWSDSVLLLTQMASSDAVRARDLTGIETLMTANVALQARFDAVSIVDTQGTALYVYGEGFRAPVAAMSFFERTRRLRRPVRSGVMLDDQNRASMVVSVPTYDLFGRFAGCALGIWYLDGSHLGLPVYGVRVGERGYAYLVDEFGTILYHPDPGLAAAQVSGHPAVAALLRGETGAQTLDIDGQRMVVGYAPIPMNSRTSSLFIDDSWMGWGLLTAERWDDIMTPVGQYAVLMIALLVLVILSPLLVLAWTSGRVTAPLGRLGVQARQVARGQFDTEVTVRSSARELRDLEASFVQMVEQLRKYRDDNQRYVVSILNSQEQERKRVARELHDETAQALIVLGRRIEMLLEQSQDAEMTAGLDQLRDAVDDTLQGVRRFTRDLRPPLLAELGLPRSLEILGGRLQRDESFDVEVQVLGDPVPLSPELELGLYRLAQEGLSNVRRHAQATHADLILTYRADSLSLVVQDNGVGFEMATEPAALIQSGRLGLMGIHERARLFGGRASILSKAGQGTTVRVTVPLSPLMAPPKAEPGEDGSP